MAKLDHVSLAVRDWRVSRDWYMRAEIADPDGHVIRLWDEKSMREKGGS